MSVTNYRSGQQGRDPTQSRGIQRGGQGSVNIPGVGSFDVGSPENELKDTFLTTSIFQRNPGDSLDGRRSFKGGRVKRQTISGSLYLPTITSRQSFVAPAPEKQTITIENSGIIQNRRQTFPGSIHDLSKVSKVVSVTTYRNGQSRNLTQSRSILTEPRAGSDIVSVPDVGTIYVGESESEEDLKETFLTTGIFQRKEGDSLHGRRSFKGQRFKRQASRRIGRSQVNNNQNNYGGSIQQQQSCSSVPSQSCTNVPRQKCSTNMNHNCQNVPRQACRSVPRQICMSVPRQSCRNIPRESCRNVPRKQCRNVPKQKCRSVPRQMCKNVNRQKCKSVPKENCRKVPQQKCSNKPQRQCRNIPMTSCTSKPVQSCKNIPKKKCRKTPRKVCASIPQKICKQICRNIYWCKICRKKHGYGHGYSSY